MECRLKSLMLEAMPKVLLLTLMTLIGVGQCPLDIGRFQSYSFGIFGCCVMHTTAFVTKILSWPNTTLIVHTV